MTGLEKIHWAKALIEEESGGVYQFVVGNVHDDLYLDCSAQANAGLYLTVQHNEKSGSYDCVFKGYTRISSGYHNAKGMQKLAGEYKQAAYFLKEMNRQHLSDRMSLAPCGELKSQRNNKSMPRRWRCKRRLTMKIIETKDVLITAASFCRPVLETMCVTGDATVHLAHLSYPVKQINSHGNFSPRTALTM